MSEQIYDTIIIGAGLSGLAAAIHLQNEGLNVRILEADRRVGGRVKTDFVDGFLLDHGFQVLLTAYPETRSMMDYNALNLKNFYPGALVRYQNEFHRFADPFRKPLGAFGSFTAPFCGIGDKLKILAIRNQFKRFAIEDIFRKKEKSTIDFLKEWNFSASMIEAFFRPFMGGIFLDRELETSSRMFMFTYKMFTEGYAALPADGMQALPNQLLGRLADETVWYNAKVAEINGNKVKLENGEELAARKVLVATDAYNAQKLLPETPIHSKKRSTTCVYFAASRSPKVLPILMLNGEPHGLINNVCVQSMVQPNYAPPGRHLISVTVVKDFSLSETELVKLLKQELLLWFGKDVLHWDPIRTYQIDYALPEKKTISLPEKKDIKPIANNKDVYVCGDHAYHGSINGVLEFARYTAEAISWDLALK